MKAAVKKIRESTTKTILVELVLSAVLVVSGVLLGWGAHFSSNMVGTQLAHQHVSFPAKGSPALDPKEFPSLQRYAGQAVDNGPKAKAYADHFIAVHLKTVGGGMTYSEVSTLSQANPQDTKLAAKVQTLFRGETLRGLLLYAWGWSVVGEIALWVAIAEFIAAGLLIGAVAYGYFHRTNVEA